MISALIKREREIDLFLLESTGERLCEDAGRGWLTATQEVGFIRN